MKRENVSCDVLVIGGSLAGLASAISAKESNPALDVLVVEKCFTGYAGKANRGGGVYDWFNPEHGQNPEWMLDFQINHIGMYLNEQNVFEEFWSTLNRNIESVDKWSAYKKMIRGEDGKYLARSRTSQGFNWSLVNLDLDYLLEVKKYALKAGVRFMDRMGLVDFITTPDNKVSGAICYHVENGSQYVFSAKAVIAACGNQDFRIMPMWSCARGEGLAAAWRRGAEFCGCEFSSFFQWSTTEFFEPITLSDTDMYAKDGMRIADNHRTKYDPDVDSATLCEWYIQNKRGNGPIQYLAPDADQGRKTNAIANIRPFCDRWRGNNNFNSMLNKSMDDMTPICIGEMSPLKVDGSMSTSITGLYGAGDICVTGSRVHGAVPAPPGRVRGSGLPFATFSGLKAGEAAAAYAVNTAQGTLSELQIAESAQRIYAPLSREGGCTPREIVNGVQLLMESVGYSLYLHEDRINHALERIGGLKERVRVMRAKDMHEAFTANEAVSMLLCAELFFRAARERKETRGWFIREDYPERNDAEFLKWINMRNIDGSIDISFEPVPIESYKRKPENWKGR